VVEIGGESVKKQNRGIYNYSEIGGICKKDHWLRRMDVPVLANGLSQFMTASIYSRAVKILTIIITS